MENKAKENLIGSPSRDIFKSKHKKLLSKKFYACDLDFILVAKCPFHIVAFLDYKKGREPITFSEVIAYNILKQIAPVFIIRGGKPETGPFKIFKYNNGNPSPEPPIVDLVLIRHCESWTDFGDWEQELRNI